MSLSIIGGKYRGRRLYSPPKASGSRPSSGMLRAALFNKIRGYLPGGRFLDLYAGTGSVGLEALSQGASQINLVEANPQIFKILKKNVALFKGEPANLFLQDAVMFGKTQGFPQGQFEVVFADPPFDLDFSPFQQAFSPLVSPGGILVLQFPTRKPPLWIERASEIKKYGESSLAFFYY